ncbi:WG repeat-containing protein [Flavobacterium glaciei]|uniref:WG repeat protein n=1 Tax=Flavobacterium glaciei TaxID=386300 RepID=A0A562PYU1_9FLAO|nr:WG repeat-containing protein [Flavobacterium glaciei]RDI56837.1 WG repeat protein [Flavobacterium glaciei]TWI49340.1 WG repeat protein [Flavobacterium glaciei]
MKKTIPTILFLLLSILIYSQDSKMKIEENRFIERRNNKFGITDSLQNIIIPFKYDFIEYENQRLIVRKNSLNGLFSLENTELVPIEFRFILPRKNDRFILWKNNSTDGLCDANGKIIIPVKYKNVSSTENDDFYITENENNLNGIYDYNGKNIILEEYKFFAVDGYKIFATKHNKAQIIDLQNSKNNIDLDEKIELIETLRHHAMGENIFQIIKKGNKFGIINSKNETIIPIIYDEIKSSQNWRYFIIKQNNKIGLINVNGTLTKEPIYDSIELRKEFIVLKRKNIKDEIYSYEY